MTGKPLDVFPPSEQNWTLGLTSLASFMVMLDTFVVTTALTAIRTDFHATIATLGWVVNAYTFSFAVLLMMGAALGDRLGRRRVFTAGIALFTASSALCALAPTVGLLIAARALQGAGAALIVPLALAQLSVAFSAQQRARALGFYGSITGLALIAGPLVGGTLVQAESWHWIFWINVPIGMIAIPLIRRQVRETFGPRAAIDLPGLMLATLAAFGLVWGVVRSSQAGWVSAEVLGSLAGGLASGAGFIVRELVAREPMVPLRLFQIRAFSWGNAAGLFYYASIYGMMFFLAQFFQTGQGLNAFDAGIRLLPMTATLFVAAPVAGVVMNRVGARSLAVAGAMFAAVGLAWIGFLATRDVAFSSLVAPLIIAGVGMSIVQPALQNVVISAVAPIEVGKASGTFNMVRCLAGVFGIAANVIVFSNTGSYRSAQAFTDGFTYAIGCSAALVLASGVASLGLPGLGRNDPEPTRQSADISHLQEHAIALQLGAHSYQGERHG